MTNFDETLLLKRIQCTSDESEEQLIDAWLAESEENIETFARVKAIWQAGKVGQYSEDARTKSSIRIINARIDGLQVQRRQIKTRRLFKYAAALVLLMGVSAILWQLHNYKPEPVLISVVNSSDHAIKNIALPDGTKVWLNLGASLTYPEQFEETQRDITVKGEVFLEVAKDTQKRFRVHTPAFTVEVTGTSFNVNTNVSGKVEVVLVEGSVNLLGAGGKKIGSLIPGQLASTLPGNNEVLITNVNTHQYTSWQEGLIIFENVELKEIIEKIEEVYHVELLYKPSELQKKQTRYNFVFRKSQSFDTVFEMLRFVAPTKDIQVKQKGVNK